MFVCACLYDFLCTSCMQKARAHCIPWNWNYQCLMWVLVTQPGSSAGAVNAPDCKANAPASLLGF